MVRVPPMKSPVQVTSTVKEKLAGLAPAGRPSISLVMLRSAVVRVLVKDTVPFAAPSPGPPGSPGLPPPSSAAPLMKLSLIHI